MKFSKYLLLIFFFYSPLFLFASNNAIKDASVIDIAIIRLDYHDYSIKGYYELSEKFKKTLPEEFYKQSHNIYYRIQPPRDFGYIDIKSILTGEPLVYIATAWMGRGSYQYPPDSLFSSYIKYGFSSPPPDTIVKTFAYGTDNAKADTAWMSVKNTNIVNKIASKNNYEVTLIYESNTKEWLIILYTRPVAPLDLALIEKTWPKKIITKRVSTTPEITLHNFSDTLLNAKVKLEVTQSGKSLYSSISDIKKLSPDSSVLVFFEPFLIESSENLKFNYTLLNSNNETWQDVYNENNQLIEEIEVSNDPVFRPVSSIRNPGKIPTNGLACDFNNDGFIDIIQYGFHLKLWKNIDGNYIDITDKSAINTNTHCRVAVVEDFNNDAINDILLIYFGSNPVLFLGEGSDIFTENTIDAGLSEITAYYDVEAFDFENDGDLDLIFQSYEQEQIILNDGTGHFTNITSTAGIIDISQTEGITAGDLNNDGFKDVIITNWDSKPKIFINNKNATFRFINGPFGFTHGRMSLIFDFDNDGYNDIFFSRGFGEDKSLLYRNKGNLTFEAAIVLPKSFNADAADINGDGMIDLILDHLPDLTLMLNKDGEFYDYSYLLINKEDELLDGALGSSPLYQFIDLDNDSDLDIYSKMVTFYNQGFDSTLSYIPNSDEVNIIQEFSLAQNYPNPFNPTTTINYSIPNIVGIRQLTDNLSLQQNVSLKVYDILGREVATLVNKYQSAGNYSVTFNANNLSSGIYFYKLQSGKFSENRKMILLK